MHTIRTLALITSVSAAAVFALLGGCESKVEPSGSSKPSPAGSAPATSDGHSHADGENHDHDKPAPADAANPSGGHHHGETTELGEQAAGGFTIKASRDGDITPGKDVPIDVWVTGGTAKVAAVRFWIGTQDAKGSMKAKAELEKDNWHTHAEIPSPLPEGSKLWVEVEDDKGARSIVGFDLKL